MDASEAAVPYLEHLRSLRTTLERHLRDDSFPEDWCTDFAILLERECGLAFRAGIYAPEDKPHSWNEDTLFGCYTDMTCDQFGPEYPPVVVLPRSTPLLRQYSPATMAAALEAKRMCEPGLEYRLGYAAASGSGRQDERAYDPRDHAVERPTPEMCARFYRIIAEDIAGPLEGIRRIRGTYGMPGARAIPRARCQRAP
jgi:hypothetical protein